MGALISVIVPVYNVEKYLDKCVNSLISQTYGNIQIILVDDGSTDSSGSICDSLCRSDPRIQVVHKKNGGLSDARNAGIEIARGEWYSFIDSDDFITSDTIERLYNSAVQNDCQISACNMIRIFDDGSTELFYKPVAEPTVWDEQDRFLTLRQPSVCNKLFHRDLFKDVRFPKGKYYEDTFVYHVLAHRAERIALTGHDGYFYLSRRESILGKPRYTDRYFDFIEAVHMRASYLCFNDIPRYSDEACLSMYAAVSDAEKNILHTDSNAEKFRQSYAWYAEAYEYLIKRREIGVKQKIRLIILRYLPRLHSKIF